MRGSYLSNESKNKSPRFSLTKINAIAFLRKTVIQKRLRPSTGGLESGEQGQKPQ